MNRTALRPCGKRYASLDDAITSKRFLGGGYEAFPCRAGGCRGWHLARVALAPRTVKAAARTNAGNGHAGSFPPSAVLLIDPRDGDGSGAVLVRLCQGCGTTRRLHRHHRRGKDAGGSGNRPHAHCPCNALTLCGECHAWAHANPREAQAMGWIVSQSAGEPAAEGVMRFAAAEGGATQYPSCDGRWLTEPQREAS